MRNQVRGRCIQGVIVMGNYRCLKCGKVVQVDLRYEKVRCPFCGNKVLVKVRPPVIKRLKAR